LTVRLLGLISSYREGPLIQHAIRTALEACDHVYVLEGPAGEPLQADVPASELGPYRDQVKYAAGRWRTDARKRTAMLEWAHTFTGPTWALWLDADEVLVNGAYLRDWLQLMQWQDETNADPEPNARCPLRLVEVDGSVSISLVKCVRTDLIRDYRVSIAEATGLDGQPARAGNFHDTIDRYLAIDRERTAKLEQGYLYWPPGPAPLDPYIVHRSILRHPARAGLRMNEQEAAEIAKR
jgi:hypothetical protein